jgi:hypothetical protein
MLRSASLLLVALTLVGCNAIRDAFSPRAEVVARANDQVLSVERLAQWAGTGRQVPRDPMALSRLAHVWVDYALFAQAVANGQNLRDSATMTAAMWPVVSQLKWERFHDRLVSRADFTAQQVDSAYQAGDLRTFQHILFQVPAGAAANVDAQKKRQAEQVLGQARAAGRGFGQLAQRYSDDPGSKVQGGLLGVTPRGQFVPSFEAAAWQLSPGGVSDVVRSPFGYHIIRRPPITEVRDSFKAGLEERAAFRGDSVYMDSLSIKRRIEPVGRAATLVRGAAQDLDASRNSGRVLVKYRGGSLRVRDLVRWLAALDPSVQQALPQATDEQINQFLKAITQRQLLLEQADSAKITLTAEDMQQLKVQHDSAISMLTSILNLAPEALRDSAATPAARTTLAMSRINDYVDRIVQGRARFFPVPPFLGELLRSHASWSVDEAGVRRALEQSQQVRAANDSTRGQPAPRMTPAPGGPPIDTTPRRSLH